MRGFVSFLRNVDTPTAPMNGCCLGQNRHHADMQPWLPMAQHENANHFAADLNAQSQQRIYPYVQICASLNG
jgi:hypothetical protein